MIAELLEFLDHSGSARTLGLGTDRRTAFVVVDSLMQNLPKHSAKSMGYGPDCPSANACLGTPLRSLRPQDTPPPTRTGPSPIGKAWPKRVLAGASAPPWGLGVLDEAPRPHPHRRRQALLRLESPPLGAYFGYPLDPPGDWPCATKGLGQSRCDAR